MNSEELYRKSLKFFPGGVNSPVRLFSPYPFFTKAGKGSKLISVEEREYIDYCMSYGALLFGHAYPPIIDVVKECIMQGTMFGTPSEKEIELAELILDSIPSMEMVRFVNTGAEATMHSIRLARGFTNKSKVVKFEGCYHGAHDSVLVKAGSGASTFGVPNSLGITDYTYDQRGRLIRVDYPGGSFITYGYDAVSNRTTTTSPAGATPWPSASATRLCGGPPRRRPRTDRVHRAD